MTDSIFTDSLSVALAQSLDPERVRSHTTGPMANIPYLEGWDCIERANELFGFGNWGFEIVGLPTPYTGEDKNGNPYTVWMVSGRLSVVGGLVFTDIGTNLQSGKGGPATEMASKGAATDALKRCLRMYGNQFGLQLYDKDMDRRALQLAWEQEQGTAPAPPKEPRAKDEPAQPLRDPLVTATMAIWKTVQEYQGKTFRNKITGNAAAYTQDDVKDVIGEYTPEAAYAWVQADPERDGGKLVKAIHDHAAAKQAQGELRQT